MAKNNGLAKLTEVAEFAEIAETVENLEKTHHAELVVKAQIVDIAGSVKFCQTVELGHTKYIADIAIFSLIANTVKGRYCHIDEIAGNSDNTLTAVVNRNWANFGVVENDKLFESSKVAEIAEKS